MKEKVVIRDVVVWRARLDCSVGVSVYSYRIIISYHMYEIKLKLSFSGGWGAGLMFTSGARAASV